MSPTPSAALTLALHLLAAASAQGRAPASSFGRPDVEVGIMGSILQAVGGVNLSRPNPVDSAGPLQIQLAITLFQLVGVNQQLNSITMSGSILMTWTDPRFRWDPGQHSGVESVHLPYRKVWTPDIYAYFGLDEERKEERDAFMVKVTANGTNTIELPFRSTSFCGIDVQLFPFDHQACTITFGSWSYESRFIVFHSEGEPDLQNYYDNQEWVLTHTHVNSTLLRTQRAGDFSVVILSIRISRQPFYYIFNLVIPATVVTLTSIFGMHAPTPYRTQRAYRSQLGVVTLLPMGVMLLTIVNDLPKFALSTVEGSRGSFSGVPLLGMYYLALLVTISLCTTSYNLFVWLDRYAAEGNPIPRLLRPLRPRPPKAKAKSPASPTPSRLHFLRKTPAETLQPVPPLHLAEASEDSDGLPAADQRLNGPRPNSQTSAPPSIPASPARTTSISPASDEELDAKAREWELVIRRAEVCSLAFYVLFVGLLLLMFFFNGWRMWL